MKRRGSALITTVGLILVAQLLVLGACFYINDPRSAGLELFLGIAVLLATAHLVIFALMIRSYKKRQLELIQAERMSAFSQLGAGITHEIKNPLTGIISFAQIGLTKTDQPAEIRELLGMIETESQRCVAILVNYLKFAREHVTDREQLEPNQLVEETAETLKHQLLTHDVSLELDLADGVPPIRGNTGELQQVLFNLALNAQQAMPKGGKVRLVTRRGDDGGAVIQVVDNGPGIPEEHRARVFDPFFTTKAEDNGTGLGLAISYGIVRNHKGSLTLESSSGAGTTFTIRLPVIESSH